jgi:REP element-mobilizing transposase RayT
VNGHKLSSIMHSIKSYTANQANRILDRSGDFWATEYFDRYIRDGKHFSSTVAYIHNNPVKAGLCALAADWPFSSARFMK